MQLVVGFVVDLILAERYIAHRQIVEVPPVGGLKSRHGDVRLGIELLGNPPADGIQLHAVQLASGHTLRQHPKEVAHAAGRLQNIPGLKAHAAHSLINRLDDRGAGVVGVEGGGPGRSIFLRGQQLLQLRILRRPGGLLRVKGIRQPAPAHILRKQVLFLRGSVAVFPLDLFQRGNGLDVAPELFFWAAFPQVVVRDMKVSGGGRRRSGFRPVNVQPFHHHVIGQMILVAGIDRHRLGVERRGLSGGSLNGLGSFGRFFNSGSGFNNRFGLVLSKTVQLAGVHSTQQRRNFIPAEKQHGQPLLIRIQHLQFDALGHGAVVGGVAGFQLHRLHNAGIGPTQPLGDLAVALAAVQQCGKLRFVRHADQTVGQHIPQVLVRRVRIYRQELRQRLIAGIRPQQLLEPFTALGPVDGVAHAGGKQLYCVLPQLRDAILLIVQIDRIAHMVDQRGGVVAIFLRDSLPDGLVFFIGNGNVNLMGRFPVPDGNGVALTGNGLTG